MDSPLKQPSPVKVSPSRLLLPLFSQSVEAGFPSPAEDFLETRLDLNELCIPRPASTYLVRAKGDSMQGVGIYSNDILVVDRSLNAKHGDIVIAALENEFTVKRLLLKPTPQLAAANPRYRSIAISEEQNVTIFGVVTYVIHGLSR